MSINDPTRRIPKKIGESDEFWRGYTLDDLLVGATPFMIGVVLTAYILPPRYRFLGYGVSVAGLVVGAIAIYATPDHMKASEWVNTYFHHLRRPKEVEHVRYNFDSVREQTDFPESNFYELSERTQELTDVERIHKEREAIERSDGAYIGAVRVEPANMALATDRRWEENVSAFADFFNNSVEWPVQVYSTTSEFPIEKYLRRRERRLEDDDVIGNPIFRRLIDEWLNWYPRELETRGTNIREHYIIVPVLREEVTEEEDTESVAGALSEIPVVGSLVGALASDGTLSEEEIQTRALGELDERIRMVKNEGIQNLDGCRAHRIKAAGLVALLSEFWEGERAEYANAAALVRENPVIAGEADLGIDVEVEPGQMEFGEGSDVDTSRIGSVLGEDGEKTNQ